VVSEGAAAEYEPIERLNPTTCVAQIREEPGEGDEGSSRESEKPGEKAE